MVIDGSLAMGRGILARQGTGGRFGLKLADDRLHLLNRERLLHHRMGLVFGTQPGLSISSQKDERNPAQLEHVSYRVYVLSAKVHVQNGSVRCF